MHILIQYHKNWVKRHSWNDHKLYSISIKTMAPQSAVIARDLSYEEEEEGGTDHMHVCMVLCAHTTDSKKRKSPNNTRSPCVFKKGHAGH